MMAGVEEGGGGAEEEVLAEDHSQDTLRLNSLVGHIENIILSEEFSALRETFLLQHCHIFQEDEENKLEYTEIYKQYMELIEGHIEREVCELEGGDFQMTSFLRDLTLQQSDLPSLSLDGEVFDLLVTFTDFLAFKSAMLEAKRSQEDNSATLGDLLQITSYKS